MRYADSYCDVVEGFDPHTYTFIGPCVVTGKQQKVKVNAEDVHKYRQGGYVQDCFPYLSAAEREFLISGTSDEGWKELFGSNEEEEDDDD